MIVTNPPTSWRVPTVAVTIDSSAAGASRPNAKRALLLGPAATGGTASSNTPYLISARGIEAPGLFGVGGPLHRAVEAFRAIDSTTELWCATYAVNAGAKAAGSLTFGGAPTANGTVHLRIGARYVPVNVTSAMNLAAVVAAVVAEINLQACGVTALAGVGPGVVDITAVHEGATGNELAISVGRQGIALEPLPAGLTVAIAAMAAGAGTPTTAGLFSALDQERYQWVGLVDHDSTTLSAFKTEFADTAAGRWGYLRALRGHVYTCQRGSVGTLTTTAGGGDPHMTVLGYGTDVETAPWAALGASLARVASEFSVDPAIPLVGLTLGQPGILPGETQFSPTERNTLIYAGASPLVSTSGELALERVISTYNVTAGSRDESRLDVQILETVSWICDDVEAGIRTTFSRKKLASDATGYIPSANVVTPSTIRGYLLSLAQGWVARGIMEQLESFRAELVVERDEDDPNRVNVLLPPDLVNMLLVTGILVQYRV